MSKPDTRTNAELAADLEAAKTGLRKMTPEQAQAAIERCKFGGPERVFIEQTRKGSRGHNR